MRVDEHTTTIEEVPVFYRSAGEIARDSTVPLYLHEAITSSDDWTAFLERTGGLAPDLIGFGRSGKGGHLDYSPQGLVDFLVRLLSELEVERVKLVGHGWGGALALMLALREPARVERLVLLNAVPLLPGFSWHTAARLWRRPVLGELAMGATSRRRLFRELRKGAVPTDAWSPERLKATWEQFDQGTQRALLRLHRAADEKRLAELGAALGSLELPVLVVWGVLDPWFDAKFADAYAAALPQAAVETLPDAGHWPWLDRSRVVELVARFLASA